MNRKDIVDRVAGEAQVTKRGAETAVDAVFAAIGEALARGDIVTVPGFGRFAAKSRSARTGRNPRTGEPIAIGPSTAVSFRARKGLKEALN